LWGVCVCVENVRLLVSDLLYLSVRSANQWRELLVDVTEQVLVLVAVVEWTVDVVVVTVENSGVATYSGVSTRWVSQSMEDSLKRKP